MKFTFNIDFAILITILTAFLFWCGYWYTYGYADYFGVSISFFDMSIPTSLIDGLLVGISKLFSLYIFLLITFFLAGNSGKNAIFIFNCVISLIVGMGWILKYLCWDMNTKTKYVYITNYPQPPLIYKRQKAKLRKCDLTKTPPFLFANMKLNKAQIGISQIKKDLYGDASTGMIPRLITSYTLFFIFIFVILQLFYSGMGLQNEGTHEAQRNFELNFEKKMQQENEVFHKFPKINEIIMQGSIKQVFPTDYRLTNICNKDSCFAVNDQKTTKLMKLENIEIVNGLDKPQE